MLFMDRQIDKLENTFSFLPVSPIKTSSSRVLTEEVSMSFAPVTSMQSINFGSPSDVT